MFGAVRAGLLGAAGAAAPVLLGQWAFSEQTGNVASDGVGSNDAPLAVPTWTVATHEWQRRSLVATETTVGYDDTHTKVGGGGAGSLEVSNGGPAIPMAAGYKNASASFSVYACPLSEMRGTQFWDPSDYRYGSEIVAGSFDLAGPVAGAWVLERKTASSTYPWTHHYGLTVYDGSQWRAVGYAGASALAPADTAKRLTVAFGPAGAKLYVDDILIGTVSEYTGGWAGLINPITLGCDPDFDHANDRRPFWGRVDEAKVWSGQLTDAEVQALPAATSSLLWKYPSDFTGTGNDKRVQDYGSVQAAMDDAATAGGYLYQDEADATRYVLPLNGTTSSCLQFKPPSKGLINLDIQAAAGISYTWARVLQIGPNGGYVPPSPSPGDTFRFIGLRIDGNAQNQDWHPLSGTPGYTYYAYNLEHAHLFSIDVPTSDPYVDFVIDACSMWNSTGDAIAQNDDGSSVFVTSTRFYATFRGPVVVNGGPSDTTAWRCEMQADGRHGDFIAGTGLQDVEPFDSTTKLYRFEQRDCWHEEDLDIEIENTGSTCLLVNCHGSRAGSFIIPSDTSTDYPCQSMAFRYCTINYHHSGGNSTGNWPAAWGKGWKTEDGLGVQFEGCVFVANGETYYISDQNEVIPTNAQPFEFEVRVGAQNGPRLATLTDCQFRARNIPAGSTVNCFNVATMSTAESLELDGVTIDAAFAAEPFKMGGVTVRHRNVLHEGTLDTTPWTNAGAEATF